MPPRPPRRPTAPPKRPIPTGPPADDAPTIENPARRPLSPQPVPIPVPSPTAVTGNASTVPITRQSHDASRPPVNRHRHHTGPPHPPAATPDGRVGRFRIGRELGRGGIGVVHLAHDPTLRRDVAIKWLLADDRPQYRQSFVEEAQITAQLQHPNIVPVYELATDHAHRPFLAMKRVVGRTFADVIRQAHRAAAKSPTGGVEWPRLLSIFCDICDAVAFAHSRGVIHRDLKPHNVMVGEFGEVLVMDWGLAKPIGGTAEVFAAVAAGESTEVVVTDRRAEGYATLHGSVKGTPAYMAPEQAIGGAILDEGADIYALGAILYCLLTGHAPIEGENTDDLLVAVTEHRIVPLYERNPHAPRELEAIALKAMNRRRRDRFANVPELRAEIDRYLDGRLVRVARYSLVARLKKWVQRRPTAAMGMALSMVFAALLGLGVSAWHAHAQAQEREIAERDRELAAEAEREQLLATQRAEADTLRRREEHEQRDAHLKMLAEAERFDELKRAIGVEVRQQRNAATAEFRAFVEAARVSHVSDVDLIQQLPADALATYLAAFARLFRAHEMAEVEVTTVDYYWYALLIYLGQHRAAEALAALDRAVELDPAYLAAHYQRGLILVQRHEYSQARAAFDRALAIAPTHVDSLVNRAIARGQLDDLTGAMADLERAIELAPTHAAAHANRGIARALAGNATGAFQDYARAIELEPKNPLYYQHRAVLRQKHGDLPGAIADATEVIRHAPNSATGYFFRGMFLRQAGNLRGAIADLDRAVSLDIDDWLAWHTLGLLLRDTDRSRAVDLMREAWRRCPEADIRAHIADDIRALNGTPPRD